MVLLTTRIAFLILDKKIEIGNDEKEVIDKPKETNSQYKPIQNKSSTSEKLRRKGDVLTLIISFIN